MDKLKGLNKSLLNIILGFFMLIGAYLNDSKWVIRVIIYMLWMASVIVGELTDYNFKKSEINEKLEKYFWILLIVAIIVILAGCVIGVVS